MVCMTHRWRGRDSNPRSRLERGLGSTLDRVTPPVDAFCLSRPCAPIPERLETVSPRRSSGRRTAPIAADPLAPGSEWRLAVGKSSAVICASVNRMPSCATLASSSLRRCFIEVRSGRCHTQRTPAGEIDRPRRFSASDTRTCPQAASRWLESPPPVRYRIEIGLQLVDRVIDLLAERDPVKLVQDSAMETLPDSVWLWPLGLCAAVIDVLNREIELVFMALGAAKLGAAVGQHARQPDAVLITSSTASAPLVLRQDPDADLP